MYSVQTTTHGIFLEDVQDMENVQERNTAGLFSYIDSDWARKIESRRSRSGHVVLFRGDLFVRWSSDQECVVASSTESEYIDLTEYTQKIGYYRHASNKFGEDTIPNIGYEDSGTCILLIAEEGKRMKHTNGGYHVHRGDASNGKMKLYYRPSKKMMTDTLAKALEPQKLRTLKDFISIIIFIETV